MKDNSIELNNTRIELKYYEKQIKLMSEEYKAFSRVLYIKKRLLSLSKYLGDRLQEIEQYIFLNKVNNNLLNKTEYREKKIVVSVTSFPKRIKKAPAALATLFKQTVKPDKIVLWLGEDEFPDHKLPTIYQKLMKAGLEIRFRKDIGVHTRWYYGMKEFPDDLIIIADDDIMYKNFIIERLYNSYKANPDNISAMAYLTMRFNNDGTIRSYSDWFKSGSKEAIPSYRFMATEVGGVLYPPAILPKETFNLDSVLRLSPKQDDLWLKCMEVMNNVKVAPAQPESIVHGTVIRGTQRGIALGISNMREDGNDVQLAKILREYNELEDGSTILQRIMRDSI